MALAETRMRSGSGFLVQVSISEESSQALPVEMFLLPEARAVFKGLVPFGNPQMWLCMPGSSSAMGRTGKQLVQAVLFPKLPMNLEALCPLLIPVNTAAGGLFKQHLFAWF